MLNTLIPTDIRNKLSPEQIREIERILSAPTKADIKKELFKEQRIFIEDPSRMKVVFCNRRAGKSIASGIYLLSEATSNENSINIYIGLTRESAKRTIWDPVLKLYNKKLQLGGDFNESTLTMSFPNGSKIYVLGVNDSEAEQEKLKGIRIRTAIIDEAGSYTINLEALVNNTIKPATIDDKGTIVLVGTPSDYVKSYFAEITMGIPILPSQIVQRGMWKVFTWSSLMNPAVKEEVAADIAQWKKDNPNIEEDPGFRQHWLGEWTPDASSLVYAYKPERNDVASLPSYTIGKWHYNFGIDLGFNDQTAITVMAYHTHDPNTYIVYSEGRPSLTITDTANWIKLLQSQYNPDMMVVDGASKQAVQEIVQVHNLPLTPAEKQGKADFIKIMNSAFISGNIKLLPQCGALKEAYKTRIWDKKQLEKGVYKENKSLSSPDLEDSALYIYRHNYSYRPQALPIKPNYSEYINKQEDLYMRRLENSLRDPYGDNYE